MAIRIRDDSFDYHNPNHPASASSSQRRSSNVASSGAANTSVTAETNREREEIIRYFEVLVDLIRRARIAQKRVLIHSLRGRNRAPAFVAAYMMHANRCTRMQALARIAKRMSKMRPSMCISDNLQRALMRWQSMLGIRSELDPQQLDSESLASMFEVRRLNAWS